jgi:L-alanine-DL-glutamate epimerase-like enolase superfamily enzyme
LSPSARYWDRDIVVPEWMMTDGYLRVPFDRPGIGVDVDTGFVDALTVRRDIISMP